MQVEFYVSSFFAVFKCVAFLFPPANFTFYVLSNSKLKHMNILSIYLMHNILILLC